MTCSSSVRITRTVTLLALVEITSAPDAFFEMWRRVDKSVSDILDHTTFAELARNWQKSQARYVANWDI